jgi:hypothetical protein
VAVHRPLDFYDEPGRGLTKLSLPTELQGLEFDLLSEADRGRLPDECFGLVSITKHAGVFRKFPLNDAGNSWLSAQSFDANHENMAMPARFIAAHFIKQACKAYGVPSAPRVDAFAASVEPGDVRGNVYAEGSDGSFFLRKLAQNELLQKQAAAAEFDALVAMPDSHFALVVHTGDGEVIRKYAMPDAEHVDKAARYFDKYAMQLRPEHRQRFASSVKNRAGELGVALPPSGLVEKRASQRWNPHLQTHLEQRKSLLPRNPEARQVLDKLAALVEKTDPEAMAQALETFDHATGLARHYDRALADAWASAIEKQASAWSADIDDHTLTESDLKKVATSGRLRSYLGEAFSHEFAKNPVEIFESLPQTEKVLIKQLATGEA